MDVVQGIILDPGTEAPEHVLRGRERGRPLCVMFYGPGQVSSNPKRYDSARLASPHCSQMALHFCDKRALASSEVYSPAVQSWL